MNDVKRQLLRRKLFMNSTLDQIVFEMLNNLRDGNYKDPGEEIKNQILNYVEKINQKIQNGENVQNNILKILETIYLLDFYARPYPEDSKWIYKLSDEISEKILYGLNDY